MASSQDREEVRPRSKTANLDSIKIKGLPDVFELLGRKYFLPVPHASDQANELEQRYYDLVEGLYKPGNSRHLHQALANFIGKYSSELEVLGYGSSNGRASSGKVEIQLLIGIIHFLQKQTDKFAEESCTHRYQDDLPGTDKVPIDLTTDSSKGETFRKATMPKRPSPTSQNKRGKENNPLRYAKRSKVETHDSKQRTLSFEKHPPILPKESLRNRAEDFPCLSQQTTSSAEASPRQSFSINESLNTSMNTDTSEDTIPDAEPEIPFYVLYEAYRVTSRTHPTLCTELTRCGAQSAWERLRTAAKGPGAPQLPERINTNAWNKLKDAAQNGKWVNEVQLSAKIKFSEKSQGHAPVVVLEPLRVEKSNQYWRTWGSHRFMTVRLPSLDKDALSKIDSSLTPDKAKDLLRKFRETGFELLDRVWKVYYFREHGHRDNGKPDGKWQDFSLIMFAVSGEGIPECSVSDLLEWHISLKVPENRKMTEAKFWSRIALETVKFQCEEVTIVEDRKSRIGKEMDDGCQLCSPAVLRTVAEAMGLSMMPTAVQARIGGAKGIWMLDPRVNLESEERWLRINETQKKFAFHTKFDPAWYTLNVLKCSHTPKPAALNTQFIPILVHRGVSVEALAELLKEDIDNEIGELCRRLDDAPYVRSWIERTKLPVRSEIVFQGSLPQSYAEIALMLLENGFTMKNCEFLKTILEDLINDYCDELKYKMHIHVPRSAHAFCVPDPTGELKEGEVFFKFSESRLDQKTKQTYEQILGDIVVGRNPAHLVSDIQRVTAVDCFALRNIKDVIVFSVQGDHSLASKLAGGDYDGDSPWICWDQRIVADFENKPVPSVSANDFFEKTSTTLMNYHHFKDPYKPNVDWVTPFIDKYLEISLEKNLIGRCTNHHVNYSYATGIDDPKAELLAAINGRLHDCAKAGERIIDKQWSKLDKEYRKFTPPHYTFDTPPPARVKIHHPIDVLKFNVLRTHVNTIMGELEDKFKATPASDTDLTKIFWHIDNLRSPSNSTGSMDEEARTRDKINRDEIIRVLRALEADLERLKISWNEGRGKQEPTLDNYTTSMNNSKPRINNSQLKNLIKQKTFDQYEMILPLDVPGNFFICDLRRTAKEPFSRWSLLKASTAFQRFQGSNRLVWQLCARELCYIKLKAVDPEYRTIMSSMYLSLKSKKQVWQEVDGEEEEEEEMGPEVERDVVTDE